MDRRFAIVPEWVIDAPISDTAFRLYAVLLRYGQSSGVRMPGRATLARRLQKKSVDTVDRALKELVDAGAVRIEHRHAGKQRLSNLYHVITDPPGDAAAPPNGSSRSHAGHSLHHGNPDRTREQQRDHRVGQRWPHPCGHPSPQRRGGGGRTDAARPRSSYPINPSPTSPHPATPNGRGGRGGRTMPDDKRQQLLAACGIADLDALAAHCQQLRQAAGKPAARWTAQQLLAVLDRAVAVDGWPATTTVPALAADPATASPMRLTASGPWWDLPHRPADAALTADEQQELDRHTAQLDRLPDSGVGARHTARAQLAAEHQPRTRLTIARRAVHLAHQNTTPRRQLLKQPEPSLCR